MSSQSHFYCADEIKALDSLVIAVISDFMNHLCCSSLYLFYFINVPSSMWGPELHLQWEDQFFIFVPEIEGFEPQYSVGRVAAFLFVFATYGIW